MDLLDLATRVKRGVKLLDKKFPGWRRVMRKHDDAFDLSDGECCILGTLEHHMGRARELARRKLKAEEYQSENGYGRLTDALDIQGDEYGFDVKYESSGDWDSDSGQYDNLSDLWRAEYNEGK